MNLNYAIITYSEILWGIEMLSYEGVEFTVTITAAWLRSRTLAGPLADLHRIKSRAGGCTLRPLVPIAPLSCLWNKMVDFYCKFNISILVHLLFKYICFQSFAFDVVSCKVSQVCCVWSFLVLQNTFSVVANLSHDYRIKILI